MSWSDKAVRLVWEKGFVAQGVDANEWRKDECGAWINRNQYGQRESQLGFGWDVDHITPVSEGGSDQLSNLRPPQWENNASRQASPLNCRVASQGNRNVYRA